MLDPGEHSPLGGEPNCVTVFGNSAGGSIVSSLVSYYREVAVMVRSERASMVPDLLAPLPSNICPLCSPLSPMFAGLSHRAISQSGVITTRMMKEMNT